MADGFAEPAGIRIRRVLGVQQNDAIHVRSAFVENHHAIGQLDNLKRIGSTGVTRHAGGQAIAFRIVLGVVGLALLI